MAQLKKPAVQTAARKEAPDLARVRGRTGVVDNRRRAGPTGAKPARDIEASPVPFQAGELALAQAVRLVMFACFEGAARAGWWHDLETGDSIRLTRNTGETLMLIVSEIAEAMEGDRKGLMDDHLPHRPMIEVELADALIRICDLAEARGLDLGGALVEKLAYNAARVDHKPEARRAVGGKAY